MKKPFTTKEIANMCQLYQSGKTIKEIADQFQVNKDVISLRLKENQIEIRKNGSWQRSSKPANFIEVEECIKNKIQTLWKQEFSLKRIAEQVANNENKVRKILLEAGIETNRHKKKDYNVTCHTCGTGFRKRPSRIKDQNFCSTKCRGKNDQVRTEIKCTNCFKKFSLIPSKAAKTKFCSPECAYISFQTGRFLYCETCGNNFYTTASRNNRYCSKDCRSLAQVTAVIVNCSMCGKEVQKNLCHLKGKEHSFCSITCAYRFRNENKEYNLEFRKNVSEGRITYFKENPAARIELRNRIIKNFKEGKYSRTRTKPHLIVCNLLKSLKIEYIEEFPVGNFVADIFLPQFNTVIEVQGTYWHADPRVYNYGKLNPTQVHNVKRDILKKNYIEKECKYKLIELWELDIKSYIEGIRNSLLAVIAKV